MTLEPVVVTVGLPCPLCGDLIPPDGVLWPLRRGSTETRGCTSCALDASLGELED